MEKNMSYSKRKVWIIRLFVFLGFFMLTEIALRVFGYKPGVLEDFYYHHHELEYDSI
jgi:hypothetical protein